MPARSCVPDAVPASAIQPASSAARALAPPAHQRQDVAGRERDPWAKGATMSRRTALRRESGENAMSPQVCGDKADPHFPIRRSEGLIDFAALGGVPRT